jgi:peptidoglycan hydrolase-like protein with peptidoglycan-binding domain
MKILLTLGLLLVGTFWVGHAQQRAKRPAALTRAEIKAAEQGLRDLGYWTGAVDGVLDSASQSALIAFQKWEGRTVDGRLTREVLEAIRNGERPKARDTGYEHVEVDLERQVLLLVNAEGDVRVLPVSTGSGKSFISDGQTSIAYTPRGRFVVYVWLGRRRARIGLLRKLHQRRCRDSRLPERSLATRESRLYSHTDVRRA